ERVKFVADDDKDALIERLARVLDVALPDEAPAEYAPLTWEQCRTLARSGVTFGPHSVTHPLLSRVGPERAREKIARSRDRVAEQIGSAVPVFCYPVGTEWSFTARDRDLVRELGFRAALTAEQGYVSRAQAADG